MSNNSGREPGKNDKSDTERNTGTDERVPRREGETDRTVGPEDEDRRVRPGEHRPTGTNP